MTDITIAAADGGQFSAYLATPPAAKGPGIVLIQEIFGVNKVMRDLADGLAAQGYFVLCPDLFWRKQPGIQLTDQTDAEWARAFELYKAFDEAKGVQDLIATLDHLRRLPGCSGRVGTVGYCLGGKLAYLMATRSSADCNVSYYGVGIETALGEAAKIAKPLLLHIAAGDQFVPPAARAQIKTGLKRNKHAALHVYAGVDHAFCRIGGKHFNAAAAELANRRTGEFFATHLEPPRFVNAMRVHAAGGPDQMRWERIELGRPGPGEVLIRHTAIGLNYIDTYHRSGLYPIPLPSTIGAEGAGIVEAVGPKVKHLKVGDRVAYAQPMGSYCEARLAPADRMVKIPAGVDDRTAAAMMLKGMTAWYLLRRTYKVAKGDWILVHAAAGGVGMILCQWGKALGAKVIGTVGSDDKAAIAKKHGAHHVIVTARENFTDRVRHITKGQGVAIVYDGIGKVTFNGSLDCLRPLGMMVTYGNASGPVPPVNLGILAQKGSLFVTRPTLMSYTAKRDDLLTAARELFAVVKSRKV
ncbi:MAG: zinc-binding dehydrogenase, partial [Alphaproteobacteria bacterium]|nr:zinc-binding dehydrogenase [Alphaproteobacteria bacterium]